MGGARRAPHDPDLRMPHRFTAEEEYGLIRRMSQMHERNGSARSSATIGWTFWLAVAVLSVEDCGANGEQRSPSEGLGASGSAGLSAASGAGAQAGGRAGSLAAGSDAAGSSASGASTTTAGRGALPSAGSPSQP